MLISDRLNTILFQCFVCDGPRVCLCIHNFYQDEELIKYKEIFCIQFDLHFQTCILNKHEVRGDNAIHTESRNLIVST